MDLPVVPQMLAGEASVEVLNGELNSEEEANSVVEDSRRAELVTLLVQAAVAGGPLLPRTATFGFTSCSI